MPYWNTQFCRWLDLIILTYVSSIDPGLSVNKWSISRLYTIKYNIACIWILKYLIPQNELFHIPSSGKSIYKFRRVKAIFYTISSPAKNAILTFYWTTIAICEQSIYLLKQRCYTCIYKIFLKKNKSNKKHSIISKICINNNKNPDKPCIMN